jgi:hypothetical protein
VFVDLDVFQPPPGNFSAPCFFSTPPFDAQYSQY